MTSRSVRRTSPLQNTGVVPTIRTAIRHLFASHAHRNLCRTSTWLRPVLTVLEDRRLLATLVVTSASDSPVAGQLNLRQAIEKADSSGGVNTVTFSSVFAAPQTVTIGTRLEVKHDFLTIDGPTAGLTVKGNGDCRILVVESNAKLTISNLTITGGKAINDNGGGVFNRGVLTLNNCKITNSLAESTYKNSYGGGVYNVEGKLTMVGCTVSDNRAGSDSLWLPHNGYGGGIANYYGTVNLVNSTVNNNKAIGNLAYTSGGGLYNYGHAYLTNSTFVCNRATFGGGLQNHGDAEVVSSTFVGNSADFGGGMFLWKSLDLWNTILANNTAEAKGPDVDGHVHSGGNDNPRGGYNLVGDTSGSSGWVSSKPSGNDLTNVAAGLSDLGNNGGPTQTISLTSTSPAIHKGTRVYYAGSDDLLETDQRGLPLASPPDIGAFQTQTLLTGS
jgi:hypothetical protein